MTKRQNTGGSKAVQDTASRHSYIRFFPSDWLAGTARLSRLHRSVYFDVCCYNWDKNAAVPKAELALMVGDIPNGAEIIETLIDAGKLVRCSDGSVANPRAMAEAKRSYDLWEAKSRGGRDAMERRYNKGGRRGTKKDTNEQSYKTLSKTLTIEPEPEPEPEDSPDGESNPPTPFAAPQPEWTHFVEYRKGIGKKLTPHAVKLNLAKLEALAAEGYDPRDIINQTIERGWTGFFPLKEDRNGYEAQHPGGKTGAAAQSLIRDLDAADKRKAMERDSAAKVVALPRRAGRGD